MARQIPGVFVTGTDYGVGKTVIGAGLAMRWREQGLRVGVFKPIATGCTHRVRIGLMSDDAECLAFCAGADLPLDVINPICYRQDLTPMAAAEHVRAPIDWERLWNAYTQVCHDADVVIVEGVGGLLTPLERKRTLADLAVELGLGLLIVAPSDRGTVNHVLLTIEAAKARNLSIAGVVLNDYNDKTPTLAEETNPTTIAQCARTNAPAVVPHDDHTNVKTGKIGPKVLDALGRLSLGGRDLPE
ncbi:MAG: dethiobiotin synthase [Phycisphaerae bacterium]|nr:dethiobiotin synthase [Phycisphaerae bacterium]